MTLDLLLNNNAVDVSSEITSTALGYALNLSTHSKLPFGSQI
jgi:hypothetical protein